MAGKRDQSQLTSRPEFLALLSSRPSSLSAPGASCRPASGTHDRGRPDALAEYHLRGPRTLSTDNLVHGTGQCSGCERSYGKRSATDLHGQCSPASSRRSSADGDGSPTGGDGSPADGSPADGSPTDGDGSPTDGDGSSANGDGSSRAGTYRPIPSAPGGCVDESIDLRADFGAIGEHLAQKKNPRIQMGQAPQMMQAPVAQAPVGAAPQGALAYAPMGYGAAPAAPQGFMGYMAVPGGGPPSGYGYGYGFGPPPGQGYGPGPGYPPCPPYPQGPPEGYPQGPPPVAPSPQGSNHWWGGHAQYNSSAQQQQPPNAPTKQGWLSSLWK